VVVVVALITGGPWLYAQLLAPEAPPPLALTAPVEGEDEPGAADPTEEATDEPTSSVLADGPVDVEGTWQVAEGSQAGYRLGEVLSGQEVTVVGRTDRVSGFLVVEDGVLTEAEVVVDAASVATDESARDAYFRRALDTSANPQATFVLTEPVEVSSIGASTDSQSVDVVGVLTFNGVSRPAAATLVARRTAGGVEVAGTVPVVLADHDLNAPDLRFVTVEPEGLIEVLLRLSR
jgi:polyisoprenoid-binding protein YceI